MGKHEIEVAKSRVRIEDGKVEVLSDPLVKRCPLRSHLYGCEEENRETVKRVLDSHIKDLGMYTSDRNFNLVDDPVSFGASEMIMDAMRDGLLDAAVSVCEGVGTVVITRPDVVETVGVDMTGIVSTSPIPEVRKSLLRRGSFILDKKGTIDQVKGFQRAVKAGYRRVAVTIVASRPEDAEKIHQQAKKLRAEVLIMAVHSTGIDERAGDPTGRQLRYRVGVRVPGGSRYHRPQGVDANRDWHSGLRSNSSRQADDPQSCA